MFMSRFSAINQPWLDQVLSAARKAGEKVWQLPLDKEYRDQIKSEIADIKNVGGRKAGTITGSLFHPRIRRRYAVGPPGHRRHSLERKLQTASCGRPDRRLLADAGESGL